jgi:hypothetical protein
MAGLGKIDVLIQCALWIMTDAQWGAFKTAIRCQDLVLAWALLGHCHRN